jgi:hypothetical protein
MIISSSTVAMLLSAEATVTVVFEDKTVGYPQKSITCTATCRYKLLSASTCGGPSKIISFSAGPESAKLVVLKDSCVEAYPCPTAVIFVTPGVEVEVKFATAKVCPCGMTTVGVTDAVALLELKSDTTTSLGALAGEPVISCSCTITAAYVPPSAGRTVGKP